MTDGYFYPRSPCGERRESQPPCERPTTYFYPRSPCGERRAETAKTSNADIFLSTLSLRRATPRKTDAPGAIEISIHALLAESDEPQNEIIAYDNGFLSTLSLRRATGEGE